MRFRKKLLLFIFLILFVNKQVFAYSIPEFYGPVNDYANVIEEEVQENLEDLLLSESKKENGVEIAIVTINSLNGEAIENVSLEFFDTWEIGKKNIDNGVLILIATKEKLVRIHSGYGAEVFLTDSASGDIIRNQILPDLKNNNYNQAITNAVNAILEKSQKIDQAEIKTNTSFSEDNFSKILELTPSILIFLGIIFTYLISYLGRTKEWISGGIIGGIIGFFTNHLKGLIILAFIGFILDYILSKNYKKWKMDNKTISWRKTWGGFYSGKSKYRFGGGRSGGGGATGKW